MTLRKLISVAGAAIACVLLLVAMKSCADRRGATSKIPAALQNDLDSLRLTRPAHETRQDSLLAVVRHDSVVRARLERDAAQSAADARAAKSRADSMAAVAVSAEQWRATHDERKLEADKWHRAADSNGTALQVEKDAHAATKLQLSDERARRLHLETVTIPGLNKAIAALEKPCRVGPLPCPSRTVIGITTLGGGLVLGRVLSQSRTERLRGGLGARTR